METAILEFEEVSKEKDGVTILRAVSFQVPENSVFVIFGRSGAGKTTLLRLVNRLEEITSGEVRYRGDSVRDQNPLRLRKKIGMVFQEPHLFPGTIRENLLFAPQYHGITTSHLGREFHEARLTWPDH